MDCILCKRPMTPWLKMPFDPKKKTQISFDTFTFCSNCSLGSMASLPSPEEVDEFYNLSTYYTQSGSHMPSFRKGFFDKLLTKLAYLVDNGKPKSPVDFKSRFDKSSKALDIGSGAGEKLIEYDKYGWDTYGLEPDARAVSQRFTNSIKVYQGTAENVPYEIAERCYDFISMTHVLEHCRDPDFAIKNVYSLLNKDGIFWCEVPNSNCEHFKKFNVCSEMFDAPRHIHYFDETSLRIILEKNGFKIEEIYFHGFTRHHDLNWRSWERYIYTEANKMTSETISHDHTFTTSLLLLLRSFYARDTKKYDCVGFIASRV